MIFQVNNPNGGVIVICLSHGEVSWMEWHGQLPLWNESNHDEMDFDSHKYQKPIYQQKPVENWREGFEEAYPELRKVQ